LTPRRHLDTQNQPVKSVAVISHPAFITVTAVILLARRGLIPYALQHGIP